MSINHCFQREVKLVMLCWCVWPYEKLCRLVPVVPVHENLDRLVKTMATRLFDNTLANVLVLILFIAQVQWVYSQDVQWPVHTVCNSDRLTLTYRSCGEITISISCFDEKYQIYLLNFFNHSWISMTYCIIFMKNCSFKHLFICHASFS